MTRLPKGDYRVKREFARLNVADSGASAIEFEILNGRVRKPNLRKIANRNEALQEGETRPNVSGIIDLITRAR